MTAFWKDGTPLTYGGIGFDLDSNLQKSRFIFCENDPSNYATDGNAFSSEWEDIPGADIRMIGSSGPVTFGAGESRDMYIPAINAFCLRL